MVDSAVENTTSYLEELAQGNGPSEFEVLILRGLELIHVGKGVLRCRLVVTDRAVKMELGLPELSITTVIESIGGAAVYSFGDGLHSSIDLNSSLYSTVKIHEKVEVEARVKGNNGGLKSGVIEIRRELDGEVIATGRLWMAPLSFKVKHNASNLSKL